MSIDSQNILKHYYIFPYKTMEEVTNLVLCKTFKSGITFSDKGQELKLIPFVQEEKGPREIEMHAHKFLELVIILSGKCIHRIENKEFNIKKGDVFFINNKISHSFKIEPDEKLIMLNFCFLPDYLIKTMTLEKLNEGIQFTLVEPFFRMEDNFLYRLNLSGDDFYQLIHIALSIVDSFNRSYPERSEIVQILFKALMVKIYQYYNQTGIQKLSVIKRRDKIIREIINTIEKKYLEDIKVEDVIQPTGLGRTRANEIFKSKEGETIIQFINRRRIEHASGLLVTSNYDILTVALDSGFNDLSYFNRVFKKIMGITPSEYRKNGKMSNK